MQAPCPVSRVQWGQRAMGTRFNTPKVPRTASRRTPAALQQARQQQQWVESQEARLLVDWVERAGGWLHPALRVVENAPCGCRGIVAVEAIPLEEVEDQPLVVVPEQLYMTHDDALDVLGRAVAQARPNQQQQQQQERMLAVDRAVLLGMLLAHERSRGPASRWQPYIQALPQRPPCAWLMSEQELQAATAQLPKSVDAQGWVVATAQAWQAIAAQAHAIVGSWGQALGVGEDDVVWGIGHVVSRCFGGGAPGGPALAPLIDCMNHQSGRAKPAAFEAAAGDEQDEQPTEDAAQQAEVMVYVASMFKGQPLPLEQGQELMISYISTEGPGRQGTAPLMAFLNFGFCPAELFE